MSIQFSPLIAARSRRDDATFSVRGIDLHELGERISPIALFDDFRVSGRPFGPHPHAGFSAITYVFEDSPGSLRSRDSLGNDLVIGPGGIVWLQAGSGALHQEVPAEMGRELHGAQIYVNLSSKNKLAPPRTLWLEPHHVREWRSDADDRVRVVVGSFENVSSSLVPSEPFNLLDVTLRSEFTFDLEDAHNALVYVFDGIALARAGGQERQVPAGHALALHGGSGRLAFNAAHSARLLILSGAEIREPVLADGPFIMNKRSQIAAASARYRAGEMGHLEPLSES
jgi:redox-sensitive bicupin YhaK (pirin superfamily)